MGSYTATPRRHKHVLVASTAVRYLDHDSVHLEQLVRSLSAAHAVKVEEQADGSWAGTWSYTARSASRNDIDRVLLAAGYRTTADPNVVLSENTVYLANRSSMNRLCACPAGQTNCTSGIPGRDREPRSDAAVPVIS